MAMQRSSFIEALQQWQGVVQCTAAGMITGGGEMNGTEVSTAWLSWYGGGGLLWSLWAPFAFLA